MIDVINIENDLISVNIENENDISVVLVADYLATGGGGGSSDWGSIGGTLTDQTDLIDELDTKALKTITINTYPISSNVNLTKSDIGLSGVDNTSDLNKPISTATQTALNAKENTIAAGTIVQYYRGDKTFQTLDKTVVGLNNVLNLDQSDPTNITQDSTHRFVTDSEKTDWNGKAEAGDSISIFTQDSTHRTVTDAEKTSWTTVYTTKTIDFGDEQNEVVLSVSDVSITANSKITIKHTQEDLAIQNAYFHAIPSVGVGYDIYGFAQDGASGQYQLDVEIRG